MKECQIDRNKSIKVQIEVDRSVNYCDNMLHSMVGRKYLLLFILLCSHLQRLKSMLFCFNLFYKKIESDAKRCMLSAVISALFIIIKNKKIRLVVREYLVERLNAKEDRKILKVNLLPELFQKT